MSTSREESLIMKRNRTKTCFFILPLVFDSKGDCFFKDIIDVHLCKSKVRSIIVKYKKLSLKEVSTLMKHESYGSHKEVDDNHLFEFRVPHDLLFSFKMFLEGKYSKMCTLGQTLVKRFFDLNPDDFIFQVFTKSSKLKRNLEEIIGEKIPSESELYDIINEKEEYINYD